MSNSGNSSLFIELTFFRNNNVAIQEGNNQYLEMCLMYDHFRFLIESLGYRQHILFFIYRTLSPPCNLNTLDSALCSLYHVSVS